MLGWEFPPYISGGLGTACFGLTKALDALGHEVVFVLPRPIAGTSADKPGAGSKVRVLAPKGLGEIGAGGVPMVSAAAHAADEAASADAAVSPWADGAALEVGLMAEVGGLPDFSTRTAGGTGGLGGVGGFKYAEFLAVPSTLSHPYPAFDGERRAVARRVHNVLEQADPAAFASGSEGSGESEAGPLGSSLHRPNKDGDAAYGMDLIGDAERYARLVVAMTRHETFDVVHAHDWLTFPAGIMLSAISGKPLVVHVHSTEYDRAGANANQRIVGVERSGMHAADKVLAVSQLTKSMIVRRYGVAPNRVEVVYNGVDREHLPAQPDRATRAARASARTSRGEQEDKCVLFLGRITWQKGPEHFVNAAKRVLEVIPNVKFVLAGAGDMALRMMDLANSLGIGSRVMFTGFLRDGDVDRMFAMADCYVMPSVSEPFGIAALEALSHDVPVIISKTSGASEVLQHVLKVDFWDSDDIANKIVAVLKYPPLAETLREKSGEELQRLTWGAAAERCVGSYEAVAR